MMLQLTLIFCFSTLIAHADERLDFWDETQRLFITADSEGYIHLAEMIGPTPKSSVLENKNFFVWEASMVQTDDGTCHMIYCRWPKPFKKWITDAELAYATANDPAGPYTFQRVILGKRGTGAEFWDGVSCYNPQILEADGKYYLYYTGSNGHNRKRIDKDGKLITQRIGVAVAGHPAGPWVRPRQAADRSVSGRSGLEFQLQSGCYQHAGGNLSDGIQVCCWKWPRGYTHDSRSKNTRGPIHQERQKGFRKRGSSLPR